VAPQLVGQIENGTVKLKKSSATWHSRRARFNFLHGRISPAHMRARQRWELFCVRSAGGDDTEIAARLRECLPRDSLAAFFRGSG